MSNQLKTTLREAVIANNLESINKLVTINQFDLYNPIDLNGLTILHFAVQNAKEKIVEHLCSTMNDVNIKDNLGRTPLHYASAKSEVNTLKILLASGANGGETPLMKAIIFNRVQCVKLLLRFGSDLTIKNKAGITALDLATNNRSFELIPIIILHEEIFCKKDNKLIF